jgi:hypothetical protein
VDDDRQLLEELNLIAQRPPFGEGERSVRRLMAQMVITAR